MSPRASRPEGASRQNDAVVVVYTAADGAIAAALQERLGAVFPEVLAICTDPAPDEKAWKDQLKGRVRVLLLSNRSLADRTFCAMRDEAQKQPKRVVSAHIELTFAYAQTADGVRLFANQSLESLESLEDVKAGFEKGFGQVVDRVKKLLKLRSRLKILIWAPDPRGLHAVPHKEGKDKILATLAEADPGKVLDVQWRFAATFRELALAILKEKPVIVHIISHGGLFQQDNVVAFENDQRETLLVRMKDLVELIAAPLITAQVRCLILSSCKGAPIAWEVAQAIDMAIGSRTDINIEATFNWARLFYGALATCNLSDLRAAVKDALSIANPVFRSTLTSEEDQQQQPPELFRKGDPPFELPEHKPAAKEPTAKAAKEPAAKKPAAKKPAAKEPAAKAAKKPAAKKPTAKEPAAKAAKKPAAKKPTAKKPAAKEPTAKKPTAKKPAAKEPTAKKPTAKKPAAKEPAAKEPGPALVVVLNEESDEKLTKEFLTTLKAPFIADKLAHWDCSQIEAGEDIETEWNRQVAKAHLAVVLVSKHAWVDAVFVARMKQLIAAAEARKLRLIPVRLGQSAGDDAPLMNRAFFKGKGSKGSKAAKVVARMKPDQRDEFWKDLAHELLKSVRAADASA